MRDVQPRRAAGSPTVPPFVFTTRGSAEQALAASDAIVTDGLRPEAS
ncbi:hypothetical protein ACWGHM_13065 [Streptomyces sp. NPDC054904]